MTYSASEEFIMNRQLRIVLTHRKCAPTREELSTTERQLGENYFTGIPLEWAGWIASNDSFCLSAQWLCPLEHLDEILSLIERTDGMTDHIISMTILDDEEAEETEVALSV